MTNRKSGYWITDPHSLRAEYAIDCGRLAHDLASYFFGGSVLEQQRTNDFPRMEHYNRLHAEILVSVPGFEYVEQNIGDKAKLKLILSCDTYRPNHDGRVNVSATLNGFSYQDIGGIRFPQTSFAVDRPLETIARQITRKVIEESKEPMRQAFENFKQRERTRNNLEATINKINRLAPMARVRRSDDGLSVSLYMNSPHYVEATIHPNGSLSIHRFGSMSLDLFGQFLKLFDQNNKRISAVAEEVLDIYRRAAMNEGTIDRPWLPPILATDSVMKELQEAGLLVRADAPNSDCFRLTSAGFDYPSLQEKTA